MAPIGTFSLIQMARTALGVAEPALHAQLTIHGVMEGVPMRLMGGSCDGGVRSYQVQSKRQGTHVRGDMGSPWGCMGPIHRDFRTALSVDDHPGPLEQSCMAMHREHIYKREAHVMGMRAYPSCNARQDLSECMG